jgi:S-DNA-T family DNA segregation ATPase FtsK/SpoIIIE
MIASVGARNLDAFNLRVRSGREAGQPLRSRPEPGRDTPGLETSQELQPLPRVVVMIDEVGDLMTTAFDAIDPMLQLLARRGHVTGIHLVLSTERPSTDVLTGAVLASIASRLCYKVVSAAESRIVLDERGAERLARYGDMLLKAAGSMLARLHGALVSDDEILAVADHWRAQGAPNYQVGVYSDVTVVPETHGQTMYEQAVAIVLECDNGSTSHLQRKLRVGYTVAAKLIEQMERQGIVGPPDHVGRRKVYEPIDHATQSVEGPPNAPASASVRHAFKWPWSR